MITRDLKSVIKRLQKAFPVIAVTGPRQSGKTTLLKDLFSKYRYINLENPESRAIVEADPSGFFAKNPTHVVIDEIQRAPQLLSYIQAISDEKNIMGNFIVSGSENLLLSEKINQSLAGRAAYVTLFPLSMEELSRSDLLKKSAYEQILYGSYPAIYSRRVSPVDYYSQYIATYVERDLKQMSNIVNLSLFRKFLSLLAGRIGQLVNMSSLGNDVGVSVTTIENWLSILEESYLILRLQPYYNNFGKRYIKSSKVYFTDTGLACRLLGISSESELMNHFLIGGLFENMVIMEVKKNIVHLGKTAKLYFFRDSNGNEVDLIIDNGTSTIPVEIKSGSTFSSDFLKSIEFWNKIQSKTDKLIQNWVIYGGNEQHLGKNYNLCPWYSMSELLKSFK